MKERFKVIPAVYVLFEREGKILMMQRAGSGYYDGYYSLPAGHLDGNEPAKVAAIREVKEEIDVDLSQEDLELVHTMHRQTELGDRHGNERIDLFFKAIRWSGTPKIVEPHKCTDLDWFELYNLPEKITPEVRQALGKVASGENYSEMNF